MKKIMGMTFAALLGLGLGWVQADQPKKAADAQRDEKQQGTGDQNFMLKAATAGAMEIKVSQLALQRSRSDDVPVVTGIPVSRDIAPPFDVFSRVSRPGDSGNGAGSGAGAAAKVAARSAARSGDNLPEMSAQGAGAALRQCPRAGRRVGPLP